MGDSKPGYNITLIIIHRCCTVRRVVVVWGIGGGLRAGKSRASKNEFKFFIASQVRIYHKNDI